MQKLHLNIKYQNNTSKIYLIVEKFSIYKCQLLALQGFDGFVYV